MSRHHVDGIALEIHEPTTDPGAPRRPVLLLHGIGGNADASSALATRLAAAGWRCLAWDAPGYGASADPAPETLGAESTGAYADAVTRMLDGIGVEQAHVLGVSWGGVIATHLAASRPGRVSSLTLVDSTRGSGTSPTKASGMRDRVTELVELGSRAFAARRAPRLLAEGADPAVADEVRRQMSQVRVPGYRGAAHMMATSDTGPLLPGITQPTLVVVGEQDRVTGVEESRLLARQIPDARLVVVADAGHAAAQEQPEAVAEAVRAFLHRLDTPAGAPG